jgi:hypothetical protein
MLPATIAICRKFCSLQAKQNRCSDLKINLPTFAICKGRLSYFLFFEHIRKLSYRCGKIFDSVKHVFFVMIV